jgi:serine/threonine protein kinase/Tol biopolymer transport system component
MLTVGTKIGSYEVIASIGAGGMGEVYRARDSKLGRQVALKVLPEAFARDADRMARFEREAKFLASLNHPHIATIHGLEDSEATHALVMELVEGPTLADRLRAGPVPIDEALPIARQICDALEFAHEHGIIHRDLKPANVKVTADDTVKLLDFGLAKALEGDPASADIATSPTMSRMATQAGILLGTAAYMSPEQAKGKPVDRRADIWAFGCVLYEMLSGKMAFRGETVTDTLAAVIKEDPDWARLPDNTPARVRVLLKRCLQKDPKQRLRDIGDARISLDEVLSGAPDATSPASAAASRSVSRGWMGLAIATVSVLAAVFAWFYFRTKPHAAQEEVRFQVSLPEKTTFSGGAPSVSPDGRKLAFILTGGDGKARLWIRSLDTLDAHPVEGTEGANGWPFWSPNSQSIAFAGNGKLFKVDISGGPPQALCDAGLVIGGTWTSDHRILFSPAAQLVQIPDSGGTPSPIGIRQPGAFPRILPDGRHLMFSVGPPGSPGSGLYIGSIDAKPGDDPPKKIFPDTSVSSFVPSVDPAFGYLLFIRAGATNTSGGTLMVATLDSRKWEVVGEPVPIATGVSSFSASATGVLVYGTAASTVTGPTRGNIYGRLNWLDRQGKIVGTFGDPGLYRTLAISPDGKGIAFERADSQNQTSRNLWLYDLERGVTSRFTFGSAWDAAPTWSPDGTQIAFTSNRADSFDLYVKPSNLAGDEQLLFKSQEPKIPSSWSSDGRFLLYYFATPPSQIWAFSLTDHKPFPVVRSDFNEAIARFSPDARWVAYESNESGRDEIYVRPFDPPAGSSPSGATSISGKWMVSKNGGSNPIWRRDGKELFYLSSDGFVMAVDVNTSGVFQAGIPKQLLKTPPGVLFYDVSADGKRFLMPSPLVTSADSSFTVVLNWQSALKK